MEAWLEWARGPLFWGAVTFMALGLARHVAITLYEVNRAWRRAGDKNLPIRLLLSVTFGWLWPFGKLKQRWYFSLTSLLFHISILIVPIFLAGHVALWHRGLGISWPAIGNGLADVLTWVAIGAAVLLVIMRATARDARALSRFQDYALPLLIAAPFVSGFLVMHPLLNPFPFEATLLAHVLSANLILVLMPLTKISHCVLLPSTQFVSELGWHFPPDAGSKVALVLGKENQPI